MKKSNGTLYWRSVTGEVITESDLSGNITSEYVFFAGRRIARRDSVGNVFYYFADHLGTTRTITDANGNVCYDAEFTPYGQEMAKTNTCPQNYKFTGYERDPETGLDYAFARYYSARLGRFLSADPLAGAVNDPQSLNRYAYVSNNPVNFIDPLGLVNIPGYGNVMGVAFGAAWVLGTGGADVSCSLDGLATPCSTVYNMLQAGALAYCLNAGCTQQANIEPALMGGAGYLLAQVEVTFWAATLDPPCPYGDCAPGTQQKMIEVSDTRRYLVLLPGVEVGGGIDPLVARLNWLKKAGVIAGKWVNGKTVLIFYGASAALGALPQGIAGAEALGAANPEGVLGVMEFVEAFTAEAPVVTSTAGLLGAAANLGRQTACRLQNDEPWYCF